MDDKYIALQEEIRREPLIERLKKSRDMIGKMCSEKRPPRMSIPVSSRDEDIFISTTIKDAIDALYKGANII